MRAAVVERYGGPDVVRIREVDEPVITERDLLVRVEAATVGSTDGVNRLGRPAFARLYFGLTRPRHPVLGYDFAGVVERVGRPSALRAGRPRIRHALALAGAHAERVRIAEDGLVARIPDGLDAASAVSILDGFFTAIPFLRDGGRVRAGQTVLVNGASGTVGSSAVQFAKHLGATVVGVCSTDHVELVRSLGADHVIDYTREDFTDVRDRYEVIFDAVGKRSFRECRPALTPDGIYLSTVPSLPVLLRARHARSTETGRRAGIMFTGLHRLAEKSADLALIGELVESGAIVPVIDGSCRSTRSPRRTAGSTAGTRPATSSWRWRPAMLETPEVSVVRAIVQHRYGGPEVLELAEVDAPTPPRRRGAHPRAGRGRERGRRPHHAGRAARRAPRVRPAASEAADDRAGCRGRRRGRGPGRDEVPRRRPGVRRVRPGRLRRARGRRRGIRRPRPDERRCDPRGRRAGVGRRPHCRGGASPTSAPAGTCS